MMHKTNVIRRRGGYDPPVKLFRLGKVASPKVMTDEGAHIASFGKGRLPIDYVVLCTNTSMDWSELLRKIDELDNMEIKNIAIVMSDLTYDVSTLERLNNIITFPENKDVIKRYVEKYKYIFPQIKIFTLDDVKNGDLLRDITMSLS